MGPETSCNFCININKKFKELFNCQPDIILENLLISKEAEKDIIRGDLGVEHFNLIRKGIKKLGLLASTKTIKERLHFNELKKSNRLELLEAAIKEDIEFGLELEKN